MFESSSNKTKKTCQLWKTISFTVKANKSYNVAVLEFSPTI